jgi:hypothetical protein
MKQQVEIKSADSNYKTYSHWVISKHGVPQGSILSPLLFLICTNDLPKTINLPSKATLLADDNNIIITSRN